MKIKKPRENGAPCKLATGRTMNGLLNKSFNYMDLPLGQKMDPGLLHPDLCAQQNYLATSCCSHSMNETTKALNILAKQQTRMHNAIY
jgi:hypothetical protein